MHFLNPPRPERIRLGWTVVLVNLVKNERRSLKQIGADLLSYHDLFATWWENSGLVEPPLGNFLKIDPSRTARMLLTYQLYEESRECLTDLGLLLYAIRPNLAEANFNPFVWTDQERWIGFYTYFQAAGDVMLALFRQMEVHSIEIPTAAKLLASALQTLSTHERDMTNAQLLQQYASRADQKDATATLVYPYLEPLRELGFFTIEHSRGQNRRYTLTNSGQRLRDSFLSDQRDADAWLEQGLSKAYLRSEAPELTLASATIAELGDALRNFPPDVTRASGQEVNLASLLAFAQAHFLKTRPGVWIDFPVANRLIDEISRRSNAEVFRKSGLTVGEMHLAWTSPQILDETYIWRLEKPTALSEVTANVNEGSSESGSDKVGDSEALSRDGNSRVANDQAIDVEAPRVIANQNQDPVMEDTYSANPSRVEVEDARPETHCWPFIPNMQPHHRLWLQYLEELLNEPLRRQPNFFCWKGVVGTIQHLQLLTHLPEEWLLPKRKAQNKDSGRGQPGTRPFTTNLSLLPLQKIVAALDSKDSAKSKLSSSALLLRRVIEMWENTDITPTQLSATLLSVYEQRQLIHTELLDEVHAYLKMNFPSEAKDGQGLMFSQWGEKIEVISRSLLLDAFELGYLIIDDIDLTTFSLIDEESAEKSIGYWLKLLKFPSESRKAMPFTATVRASAGEDPFPSRESLSGYKLELARVTLKFDLELIGRPPNTDSKASAPSDPLDLKIFETECWIYEAEGEIDASTPNQAKRLIETYVKALVLEKSQISEDKWNVDCIELQVPDSDILKILEQHQTYVTLPEIHTYAAHHPDTSSLAVVCSRVKVVGLDERCRRVRALISLGKDRSPSERLAQCWSALEQLIDTQTQRPRKTLRVIDFASRYLTLWHILGIGDQLFIDLNYALGATLLFEGWNKSGESHDLAQKWLGERVYKSIEDLRRAPRDRKRAWLARGNGVSAFSQKISPAAIKHLQQLLKNCERVKPLQDLLAVHYPRVSYRLTHFFDYFNYDVTAKKVRLADKGKGQRHPLSALRDCITAFLLYCYELRNRHIHEADLFLPEEKEPLRRHVEILQDCLQCLERGARSRLAKLDSGIPADLVWEGIFDQHEQLLATPFDQLSHVVAHIFRNCE